MKRIVIVFLVLIVGFIAITGAAKTIFPYKYGPLIEKYSEKYDVDPYLVLAIIKAESNFRSNAVSRKNARGLMQISEITGGWGAEKLQIEDYSHEALYDVETNILIGCWYLSVLYREFDDTDLVITAYNGGSGNVTQWLKNSKFSSDGKSLDKIPFSETEKYLDKVKKYYKIYKKLY